MDISKTDTGKRKWRSQQECNDLKIELPLVKMYIIHVYNMAQEPNFL